MLGEQQTRHPKQKLRGGVFLWASGRKLCAARFFLRESQRPPPHGLSPTAPWALTKSQSGTREWPIDTGPLKKAFASGKVQYVFFATTYSQRKQRASNVRRIALPLGTNLKRTPYKCDLRSSLNAPVFLDSPPPAHQQTAKESARRPPAGQTCSIT